MAASQRTRPAHNFKDMTGQRFGLLVAIEFVRRLDHDTVWLCKCDCGDVVEKRGQLLRKGLTTRCCFSRHYQKKPKPGPASPERISWQTMRQRCHNPNDPYYFRYGGRGIQVCERWRHSFAAFLADMGPRPVGTSIERENNDGNYEPGNCRWATAIEQGNNKRSNRRIEFNGRTQTLTQWSREIGIKKGCLAARLNSGMSVEEAFTKPLDLVKSRTGRQSRLKVRQARSGLTG